MFRLLLPEMGEIKGELKALNGRVDSLNTKMEAEFKVVHSEIKRLGKLPMSKQ